MTRETSENVNVVEIELNPDEENLTNEELVERMFGNEENVIEFFKQGNSNFPFLFMKISNIIFWVRGGILLLIENELYIHCQVR